MYCHFVSLLAVAFSVTVASAQSLGDIPNCAQSSALNSISSTGCNSVDFKCICNNKAWLNSLLPEIEKACSSDDLKKTEEFAKKLCAAQGVTLTISNTASATGTGTAVQATSWTTSQTMSSSMNASAASSTAKPSDSAAAATVGYNAKKHGTVALLGMLAVAFGMAAWC